MVADRHRPAARRWPTCSPFAPHGWCAIGPAAAVLVWGFAGWEAVTSLAATSAARPGTCPGRPRSRVVVVGVLYLRVAAPACWCSARRPATTEAPLADLLADRRRRRRSGSLTAVVAVLLTLGRDERLLRRRRQARRRAGPGRRAARPGSPAGSSAGEVPRRSLAVVAGLVGRRAGRRRGRSASGPTPLVLLTTGSFVLVYVLGTRRRGPAAAARTWSRRAAVVALVSVARAAGDGRASTSLWPLGLTGAALAYHAWRHRSSRPNPPVTPPAG